MPPPAPQHSHDSGVLAARDWASFAWARWNGIDAAVPAAALVEADIRRLGLAPLVHVALEAAGDERASSLLPDYRHATTANLLRLAQAGRLRDALEREGIRPVLLKGAAFLVRFAHDDLGIRSMADVDLLVEARRFSDAQRTARDLGYRPAGGERAVSDRAAHAVSFVRDAGPMTVEIDMHRGLAHWPMHAALAATVHDGAEEIDGWRVPSIPDAIAIVAIHRARHAFIWSVAELVDLRCLIARVPDDAWPECVKRLHDARAIGAAYASFRQALYWLGAESTREAARLRTLSDRLTTSRRRVLDRIAPRDGPLCPPLDHDRPLDRHLRVLPAVYGSRTAPVVAAVQHLTLRLVDEWRASREDGRGLKTWASSVWHHSRGGARRVRERREQA